MSNCYISLYLMITLLHWICNLFKNTLVWIVNVVEAAIQINELFFNIVEILCCTITLFLCLEPHLISQIRHSALCVKFLCFTLGELGKSGFPCLWLLIIFVVFRINQLFFPV